MNDEENEELEWEKAKKLNSEEDISKDNEEILEYDEYDDLEIFSKKGIISIIIIAILLFIFGIGIGRKILLIDETAFEKAPKKYATYEKSENKVQNDTKIQNIQKVNEVIVDETEQNEEEEVPIIYARYKIEDASENNEDCGISFGKGGNFSFCLGENDSYIHGSYHVDGDTITCNGLTYRDAEKQEPINSNFKLKVLEKEEIEITEVNIYEGNEGLDQKLIALNGLKVRI